MPTPISIVIPTCGRGTLLSRTLDSVAACRRPPSLRRVVVIENGEKGDAEQVVARFHGVLPISYDYVSSANKSRALNHVLRQSRDELMVFLDDDVRIHPDTLVTYAEAGGDRLAGMFWGGWCGVDYEEAPPVWLKQYLPPSATGWSLGAQRCRFDRPVALGFNWAAYTRDLQAAGGFDEERGPGTLSRGQETDMQERLLALGIEATYLPEAKVWHYVPVERCTERWALRRCAQTAIYVGVTISRKVWLKRLRHDWLSALKIWGYGVPLHLWPQRLSPQQRFHCEYWREWFGGVREGIRLGRSGQARVAAHAAPASSTVA